jgi:26S proteasome regulatory subunit N1
MAPETNKASGSGGATKNDEPVKAPPSKKKEEKKDDDLVSFIYFNFPLQGFIH